MKNECNQSELLPPCDECTVEGIPITKDYGAQDKTEPSEEKEED
jgi:hypothetical protein